MASKEAAAFPRGKLANSTVLAPAVPEEAAAPRSKRLFHSAPPTKSSKEGGASSKKEGRAGKSSSSSSKEPAGSGAASGGGQKKGAKRATSSSSNRAKSKEAGETALGNAGAPVLVRRADELSFKRARVGTAVLCRVRRVTAKRAVLSLPHGLTGFCGIGDINDAFASQGRAAVAAAAAEDDDEGEGAEDEAAAAGSSGPVERGGLATVLTPGQYVVGTIVRVGDESLFNPKPAALALAQALGAVDGGSRGKGNNHRIVVSLKPELANQGVTAAQLRVGSLVSGYVRSVEDHGYVVECGVGGVSAFLPFSNTDGSAGQAGTHLTQKQAVGMPLLATVTAVNRATSVLTLSTLPAAVEASVTSEPTHTIFTLKPGARVTVKVARTLDNGLAVTFLTFFHGSLFLSHLPRPAHALWDTEYQPGDEFDARILYVNTADKVIALSAAPHIVGLGAGAAGAAAAAAAGEAEPQGGGEGSAIGGPAFSLKDGDVVEAATVLRVDIGQGMLIGWGGKPVAAAGDAAPSSAKAEVRAREAATWGCTAYVHISRVGDERVAHLERLYRPGATVRARIIGFSGIEGHALASTQPSVVDAAVLRVGDVKPGALLVGTVEKVLVDVGASGSSSGGSSAAGAPHVQPDFASGKGVVAVIRLGEGVTGVVPALHLADALPTASFRTPKARAAFMKGIGCVEGARISVRVLSCDGVTGRVQVSLKKGLLTSALPVLASYEQAYAELRDCAPSTPANSGGAGEGVLVVHGCVTGFREAGVIVTFFNGISGMLPVSDLLAHGVLRKDQVTTAAAAAAGPSAAFPAAVTAPLAVLQSVYALGQLVKVRVASVAIRKERMRLSIGLHAEPQQPARGAASKPAAASAGGAPAAAAAAAAPAPLLPPAGSFVDGIVVSLDVERGTAVLRLVAVVSVPGAGGPAPGDGDEGEEEEGARHWRTASLPLSLPSEGPAPLFGELHAAHLTDARCAAPLLASSLPPVGTRLRDLLVLQQNRVSAGSKQQPPGAAAGIGAGPSLLLTAKPALRFAARAGSDLTLPSSLARIRSGMLVVGYVAQVTAFGAFVRFLDGCTGLAPRSRWPALEPASAAAGAGEAVAVGQTVTCVVHSVNLEGAVSGSSNSGRGAAAAVKGRFALDLTAGALSRCLSPSLLAAAAPPVPTEGAPAAACSLVGLLLRSRLLPQELEAVRSAAAAAPTALTRAHYPTGRLCVARVVEADGASMVVQLPPPAAASPTAASAPAAYGFAEGAPAFSSPSVQSPPAPPAAGALVVVRILDVDLAKKVVIVDVVPGHPAALAAEGDGGSQSAADGAATKRKRAAPDAAVAAASEPRWLPVELGHAGQVPALAATAKGKKKAAAAAAAPSSPSAAGVGAVVSVRVLRASASHADTLLVELVDAPAVPAGTAAPAQVGFAAVSDAFGAGSPSPLEPGSVHHASVLQTPAALPAGGDEPLARAGAALSSLLLLSLAPAVVSAAGGSAGTAAAAPKPERSAHGGKSAGAAEDPSSLRVEALLPGMTVTGSVIPPRSAAAALDAPPSSSSATPAAASSPPPASGRMRTMSTDSAAASEVGAPAASTASVTGAPGPRGAIGLTEPLHIRLVGVKGRYDAQISLAECVELDAFGQPPPAPQGGAGAAAAASVRLYNQLRAGAAAPAGPAGTSNKPAPHSFRVVSITRETARSDGKTSSADGAPAAGASFFYRISLTARRADASLPELHLASQRMAWAADADASGDAAAAAPPAAAAPGAKGAAGAHAPAASRLTSPSLVTAVSAATLAATCPANPYLPSLLHHGAPVAGAVCYGVVEGQAPDGAFLWVGLGGSLHAQCFVLEAGDSDEVRDAASGRLLATAAAATRLLPKRLAALHPVGSLVPVVVLSVDAPHRRAQVSIRRARAAEAVARAAVQLPAAQPPKRARKEEQPSAAAAAAPAASELERFDAATAAVRAWLAASAAAEAAPGSRVLARVYGTGTAAAEDACSLRLQVSARQPARACISHLADRADWRSKPAEALHDGAIVVAVVLAPPAHPVPSGSHHRGSTGTAGGAGPACSPGLAWSEQRPAVALSLRPSWVAAAEAATTAAAAAATTTASSSAAASKKKRAAPPAAAAPSTDTAAADALAALEAREDEAVMRAGALVSAFVTSSSAKGCFLVLGRQVTGRCLLSRLADGFVKDVGALFPPGKLVTGLVTGAEPGASRVDVSLRRTDIAAAQGKTGEAPSASAAAAGAASALTAEAPPAAAVGFGALRPGMVFDGRITKVAEFGVFIALDGTDRNAGAAAPAAPSSSKRPRPQSTAVVPISGLCHVSEVQDNTLTGSKLRGALPERFREGDRVRTVVVSCDAAERKVALSLRASRLQAAGARAAMEEEEEGGDQGQDGEEDEEEESGSEPEEGGEEEDDDEEEGLDSDSEAAAEEEEEDEDEEGASAARPSGGIFDALEEDEEEDGAPASRKRAAAAAQPAPSSSKRPRAAAAAASSVPDDRCLSDDEEGEGSGADSGDDAASGGDGHSDDGPAVTAASSKAARRAASRRAAAAQEDAVSRAEARIASGEAEAHPESVADHERLVASYPASAHTWISYMAWQLSVTETGAARAVAARGLAAIPQAAEAERLKLWTALLNLEFSFGDAKSLAATFAAAQANADARAVHLALLGIYERAAAEGEGAARRAAEAEALFATAARRFGGRPDEAGRGLWVSWAAFRFKRSDAAGARGLLKRAMEVLPSSEHIRLMEAFAILEYTAPGGSQERGRTMFDGILAVKQRLDVWLVYIDQEVAALRRRAQPGARGAASADVAAVRRLFDRLITLRLSSKKMKHVFSKFLKFEEAHGDAAGTAHVREAARAYVASVVSSSGAEMRDD